MFPCEQFSCEQLSLNQKEKEKSTKVGGRERERERERERGERHLVYFVLVKGERSLMYSNVAIYNLHSEMK